MITALIIDDETSGCIVLEELIKGEHNDIKLLPSVSDLEDAIVSIDTFQPDLVFLDIKLGDDNGFEVLQRTIYKDFHVIFVTAYSEYALQAIKVSALDYLLKPIGRSDLATAIDRYRDSRVDDQQLSRLSRFLESSTALNERKITLPSSEGYELVTIRDILYLSADRNYTRFHFLDGTSKLVTRTLGFFEDQLKVHGFLRIHKSHIINLKSVKMYIPGNGGSVRMSNGVRLGVSKRKKKDLLDLLNLSQNDQPVR